MYKIFLSLLVFLQVAAYAQTGTLKGIASDSTNSEALIGAVVSVVDNNAIGGVTDIDGSFVISNIPAGTYSFKISYLGYVDQVINNVVIKAGETTDLGKVTMAEESTGHTTVTVIGTRQTNTETAVIQEIKESEQVVSGISSEQISKSQDRDAAQVISRVPGVTVVDNKFVMVRGLNQRYNAIMLNGVNAPSTEVDSRAFAFDIIPSGMLDRMLVFKSGAPELMGDMSGSLIKVYTKNIVNDNFNAVSVSVGVRPGTTFTSRQVQTTSTGELFGFGGSSRALPSSFPSSLKSPDIIYDPIAQEKASKSVKNDWNLKSKSVGPDLRFGVDIGRKYAIGSKRLSSILSVSYSNTWQYANAERSRNTYVYDAATEKHVPTKIFNYNYEQLQNNVRLGLIWNFAMILNSRNKLEFKNMFNQNGFSETSVRTGADLADNAEILDRALYYQQRSLYSGQFSGSHDLKNDKTNVNWTLGYSNIARTEPNYRRGGYQRSLGTNDPFRVVVPSQATDQNASRFDSKLNENIISGTINVEHQLTKVEEGKEGIKLRAGVYVEQRTRKFESRWMSYIMGNATNFDPSLLDQPLETIFSEQNINAQTGFLLNEGTDGTNKYDASNQLMAGYLGATIPLRKFNISAGVRVEHNIQTLNTKNQSNAEIKVDNPITSFLPSINVAYNISEKMLIRAAFAQTINRPEFREIAPFGFYDYVNNWKLTGSPTLKVAQINNYDLRWEYYPSANESVSFGGFYKDFTNPIELYIEPVGTLDPAYLYGNAPKATCYGVEAEVRKSLNFIADKPVFEKFSVLINASLIKSEVKLDEGKLLPGQQSTRPLQGQSPYVVNAGLYYIDEANHLQVNIMYNVFGPRIFGIGDKMFATVYQVERHVIDLTVTKGIGKHLELKGGIQDLLNQAFIMKEDSDRDFKKSSDDQQVSYFKRGSYITLGALYRF